MKGNIMTKGLIIINTGDGKGKTTAALGTAMRAAGHGMKVLILQFIKSGNGYGEIKFIEKIPNIEIRSMGEGFVYHRKNGSDMQKHQAAANNAWEMVKAEVKSEKWDMIVLDEINYAIKYGLIAVEEVEKLLDTKPEKLNLILTGRDAQESLIDRADTVSEMKVIKHAYQKGIKAKKGIEF